MGTNNALGMQNNIPQINTNTLQPPKSPKNNFGLIFFIVIVCAVVFGLGGFFIAQNKFVVNNTKTANPSTIVEENANVEIQTDDRISQNLNNQSEPLEIANLYLSAYVNKDWEVAKSLCQDPGFDENLTQTYNFTKYEITGSKANKDPNYYHVYVKFTDKNGTVFDKAPHSNDQLQVLMYKSASDSWKALTWYFYE